MFCNIFCEEKRYSAKVTATLKGTSLEDSLTRSTQSLWLNDRMNFSEVGSRSLGYRPSIIVVMGALPYMYFMSSQVFGT